MTKTIYCDEFRKIFKIDKPCCASCHDEYEDDNNQYYETVIGSDFTVIELPNKEYVFASLCCSMIHTKELKEAARDDLYGKI